MGVSTSYLAKIGTTEIPNIKGYAVQYNKLWTDAGRNMAGTLRASFTGIFPKIVIETAPMGEDDMATLVSLLNVDSFTLYWWDPETKTHKSATYYSSDFDVTLLKKTDGIWDSTKFSLVPFAKRT